MFPIKYWPPRFYPSHYWSSAGAAALSGEAIDFPEEAFYMDPNRTLGLDVEGLFKRPNLGRPVEEVLLPAVEADQQDTEAPKFTYIAPVEYDLEALNEEASELQDLLDTIEQLADVVEIEVPEEEAWLVGSTVITTKDYFGALRDHSARGNRVRERFEEGVLGQSCGVNALWPILGAFDIAYLRDSILSAVSMVEGQVLQSALGPMGSGNWADKYTGSVLPKINRQLLDHSRAYREAYISSLDTLYKDMRSALLRCFFEPVLAPGLDDLLNILSTLRRVLEQLRDLLCMYQIVYLLATYKDLQNAVLGLLKEAILKQAITLITTLLSDTINTIVSPLINSLTEGITDGSHSVLDCLGDEISIEIANLVQEAASTVVGQYQLAVADLLRQVTQENQARMQKLSTLNKYSSVGRYLQHIQQAILLLDSLESLVRTGQNISSHVTEFLDEPLASPRSGLVEGLLRKYSSSG